MEKLRGGQPLTWHRVIERYLHSINTTTKDAKIKVEDRENYLNNIVTRVKVKAIHELFPEEEYPSSSVED